MTLLRLDGLCRVYGGLHALADLTLSLEVGARHAVIGANGAGKTTLFHLIAGSVRPTSGRILLDGRDVTRASPATRARCGVSRTFQHPAVFDRLSVAANVTLAAVRRARPGFRFRPVSHDAVAVTVRTALAGADLSGYADVPAGSLSYGLRRRLELAVALATRPRLLLLDEPSAGLDPDEVGRLVDTIRGLPAEVTVLLIDHHLDLVWAVARTVTVLHHGRHVATGTTAEVRAAPAVQAAYLDAGASTTPPDRPAGTARNGDTGWEDEWASRRPGPAADPSQPVLRVRRLRVAYHGAPVLHELDLDVADGEVLAVLGRNGAGKTSLLGALAGLVPPLDGSRVELAGVRLPPEPHRIARAGAAIVPQGRRLFDLTVGEHLTIAAAVARRRTTGGPRWTRAQILELFPPLAARLHHHATQLSGGEQQMLAFARALLGSPRVLLLDEPSEGLAPAVVTQLAATVRLIAAEGVTVLLAEQNLRLALGVASRIVVLDRGRILLDAAAPELAGPAGRRRLDALLGIASGAGPC